MKLVLNGHDERYVVEQSLMSLFPGELPVYDPILPQDDTWAVITLQEDGDLCRVCTELSFRGSVCTRTCEDTLTGSAYAREGQRRYLVGRCFFLAAEPLLEIPSPWGMLTGVRPDKPVTQALLDGQSLSQIGQLLEQKYFVEPQRAKLALETGTAAWQAAQSLDPRDIAVYVGIPFCPTRCSYCSFVSQSVERSFSLLAPYTDALIAEIRAGGAILRRLGLRVRAFYMGGGTPTTLSPQQMDRVLSAASESFDWDACQEKTVEAGRPDTITEEILAVLRRHGINRVSVNPQTMENSVLAAIGRRHTAEDVEAAVELVRQYGFSSLNMDLIAGLPGDTPEGFSRSLLRCLALHPENLTVHTLALKKGSRLVTEGLCTPDAQAVSQMLEQAAPQLRSEDFSPYYLYRQKYMSGSFENIGWCRPDTQCLYNVYIMSELCSILSFGAGGSTKMVRPGNREIQRVFNLKYPKEYTEHPEKVQANLAAFAAFYEQLSL